jgi:signal transduction histidine kinase
VDLAPVCANVFKLYEPLAEAKPVASRPEAPAPLPVPGDFELLVEAIANLVDNATKFTPEGGVVAIVARAIGDRPAVRVTDNGQGIPAGERNHIIKRFYRCGKTRHIPGSGLGLSMVATIADPHGFDLRIEDNRPGAVFELSPRPANYLFSESLGRIDESADARGQE